MIAKGMTLLVVSARLMVAAALVTAAALSTAQAAGASEPITSAQSELEAIKAQLALLQARL
ncbi:MAG: hypothetical protein FJ196_05455, partial [Gammaproteobacteria bacterium]|nr:hypothetical protein [Gammaproteobacteria bacterium]